ncbi:dynamin family protein [Psychroflexus torquis]|uniref:dynamin family protein n=1 Tax=Psychroflexus torquis TaxID=57029 RepID=UPI0012FCEED1|nr:dynamin family protein [Psychroflexus torquis]
MIKDFKSILTEIKQKDKDDVIKQYFVEKNLFTYLDKIDKSEAQIVIAATMSAGKSTLINALLGESLMPSKNEACTATICKIKDIDGKENFSALVKNENGNIIDEHNDLNADTLSKINDSGNDKFLTVEIEGDIKNISSENISVVLIDTPGPNNSQNDQHKEVTYNYIKDSNHKPLIIYLLDVTKLKTTDDKSVLEEIAEFIKDKGVSTEDRFLFVLNRIDDLDHEKESIETIIISTKKYLAETIGISNPKIFPISAEFARLCQSNQTGKLTRNEKLALRKYEDIFLPDADEEYAGIDIIKFAPILEKDKESLLKNLDSKDRLTQCLHRSGISALQLHIQKYIENVHETELGHDLLSNLIPHFDKLKNQVQGLTEKEKKAIKEDIKKIKKSEKVLNSKLEILTSKLSEISSKNNTIDKLKNRVEKDFGQIYTNLRDEEATKSQAYRARHIANKVIQNLEISLKSSVRLELDYDLKKKWIGIINIIKIDFDDFINDLDLSDKATSILSNDFHIILNSSNIYRVKTRRIVKTGEVEISTSTWWKPKSWFSFKKEEVWEIRDEYDLNKIYNELKIPELKLKVEGMLDNVNKNYNDNVNLYIKEGKKIVNTIESDFSQRTTPKLLDLQNNITEINQKTDNIKYDLQNYLEQINKCK